MKMKWPKRVLLFVVTNILIVVTLSIIIQVFGLGPQLTDRGYDLKSLFVFCLVWGMGGAFISLAMSRFMAKMAMGVKLIDPNTNDPAMRDLVQTVYRLSQRAGIRKMPEVGFFQSPEVNAFATGPTQNRALVAVSTGLLQTMNRDEVEGVLGHEVAHVANGDMVTMTLVQGVVNAFVMFFARVIAAIVTSNMREDARFAVRFMITLALEFALGFLGMIVVASFSRWREYRADRGGAELAGRAKMIAALQRLIDYRHQKVQQDSFASFKISGGGMMALFSTHPRLEDRIARLTRVQ